MIKAAQHGERFLCDKNDNLVERNHERINELQKELEDFKKYQLAHI